MANCGGRPNNPGTLVFSVTGLEVRDALNNPVETIALGAAFTLVAKCVGSGTTWTFNNYPAKTTWETNFYANAIGIDVGGEIDYNTPPGGTPVIGALTPDPANPPNGYLVQFAVPGGITIQGLYEFGVVMRLPGSGCFGWCDEVHVAVETA